METVHHILEYTAETVDLVGIAIMFVGAIKFILMYMKVELSRLTGHSCVREMQAARRVLGGYILAALELLIVADVMSTILTQSIENLYSLGAIVLIRTAIGYFLAKELKESE